MNKKIFLVIQGHTKYCDVVLDNVKEVENVIWSTDSDAPKEHLDKIEKSNVTLVVSDKPRYSGYGNVNIQVNSTIKGLEKAKSLGATHAIKLRSDLIFTNPNFFIDNYDFDDRIHMMYFSEHTEDEKIIMLRKRPQILNWFNEKYSDIVSDIKRYCYPVDFTNLGLIEEMIIFWSLPYEKTDIRIPAEHKFNLRYLKLKGYKEIELSLKWFLSVYGIFNTYCAEKDIPLFSLKHGWDSKSLLKAMNKKIFND